MSEEVIIDGVNVSECETTECKNKDCYFKQLQYLKKENERLSIYIETINNAEIFVNDNETLKN